MKKCSLFLLAVMALVAVACENKTPDPSPEPSPQPEPTPVVTSYKVSISDVKGGTVKISSGGKELKSGDAVEKNSYVVCEIVADDTHFFESVNVYKGQAVRDSFKVSKDTTIIPVFSDVELEAALVNFKVCNYNIRLLTNENRQDKNWNNRKGKLFEMINKHSMDVCGIEELTVQQLKDFKSMLTDYEIIGYGRDNGKEYGNGGSGEGTALVYRKNNFVKQDQGRFFLSNTPNKPSKVSGASFNRMVTWVKLKERSSEKVFYFFATHFDHPTTATGIATRSKEADIALQIVPEISGKNPVFFVGDFNCRPEEAAYTKLSAVWNDSYITMGSEAQGGYVCDAEQKAIAELEADCNCKGNTYTGAYNTANDPLPKRIDYVLYDDDYAYPVSYIADCDSLGYTTLPSDHLPVVTEMKFK